MTIDFVVENKRCPELQIRALNDHKEVDKMNCTFLFKLISGYERNTL